MPDKLPVKPRLPDNFASFDTDQRRSGRRKATWPLRPTALPSEAAKADAARFVNAVQVMQGLGRRKPE
jgi:hypothetical protein